MGKTIRFGVIGYGQRGSSLVKGVLFKMDNIEVTAVCDKYSDRCEAARLDAERRYGKSPTKTLEYREILDKNLIDAVLIASDWETHIPMAIDAMRAGVAVALEVSGAYTMESLWDMVSTYEETETPLMFLENCCFGKRELAVTAMVRDGLLGEIVHCHGAYGHYLAEEIAGGNKNRHYRLRNYLGRCCENYPTHEIGPIAKLLRLGSGNRMVSLVSVASKACGMTDYIARHAEEYPDLTEKSFLQGDMINTIITCADGTTITLRLDTTLPRSYSREFNIHGTRGLYEMNTDSVFLDGDPESMHVYEHYSKVMGNAMKLWDKYLPQVWKDMTEEKIKAGHGGMDFITLSTFAECLTEGKPMPIDVYDAASWMAVTVLSEKSISEGGAPQQFPDFTRGRWVDNPPKDVVSFDYLD